MTTTITSEDFMTGILAGLALRKERVVEAGDTRFDQALAAAYQELLNREDAVDARDHVDKCGVLLSQSRHRGSERDEAEGPVGRDSWQGPAWVSQRSR